LNPRSPRDYRDQLSSTQWYGEFCATSFYYMVSDGFGEAGTHSAFKDKPIFWSTP